MKKSGFKNILYIYLPVLLEQVFSTISTMIGVMLVSGLGITASAGVGIVDQLNFLFMNLLGCVATGITAIISQCIGSGDVNRATKSASQSISLCVYASLIVTAILIIFKKPILYLLFSNAEEAVLESAGIYLFFTSIALPFLTLFNVFTGIRRAAGDNLSPLISAFLSNIIHIGVTLFCIRVLKLGISSVGFGLLASRMVSSFVLWFFVYKRPKLLPAPKVSFKVSRKVLRPVLNIAVPNAIDSVIFNGGKLLVQVFISGMGTIALSANTISLSIINFVQLPLKTFQITSVPITAKAYGSGDMEKTKKTMLAQLFFGNVAQAIMSIVFYMFCRDMFLLYTKDKEVLKYVNDLVTMFLILSPFLWATSFMLPSALRATGDAKFTMRISVISLFLVRIFLCWLLGVYFKMGIHGIWIGMYVDWAFRSVFYFTRLFSTKWHIQKNT